MNTKRRSSTLPNDLDLTTFHPWSFSGQFGKGESDSGRDHDRDSGNELEIAEFILDPFRRSH